MARKRHGAPSPVTVQLAIRYAMPKNKRFRMSRTVIDQAVARWVEDGEEPEGFEIRVINWQHGDKVTEADNSDGDRETVGRLLRHGAKLNFTLRRNERV